MTHPLYHAECAATQLGIPVESTIDIHVWLDATKNLHPDARHRALRHHLEGVCMLIKNQLSGVDKEVSGEIGYQLSTTDAQIVAALHIFEDCYGHVPTVRDWAQEIQPAKWHNPRSTREQVLEACQKRCGGKVEDYIPLVEYFTVYPGEDRRVAYYRLHAEGIFAAERRFGISIPVTGGSYAPTRYVAEVIVKHLTSIPSQRIPTVSDWLNCMRLQPWMNRQAPVARWFEDLSLEQVKQKMLTILVERRSEVTRPRFVRE